MANQIYTLIGVFLGGMLGLTAPFVSQLIQQHNKKKEVAPELCQTIYRFFNYQKVRIVHENQCTMEIKSAAYCWSMLQNINLENKVRIELERQYKELSDSSQSNEKSGAEYFDKCVEVESIIHRFILDVRRFYGESKYLKIEHLIKPHLHEANFGLNLFDYKNLTKNELEDARKNFRRK